MILEKLPARKTVRGHQLVPSLDMPNMPAVGTPPRAVSPRIRKDMFRRKDSFCASSSASSSTQVKKFDFIYSLVESTLDCETLPHSF